MQTTVGLSLALVSAILVNWAYSREHDAAAEMPRFSPRRPVQFVRLLLADRFWVRAFALESIGWSIYVAALRLAPLSLVQAVCASGIAVLALVSAHGRPRQLARHEQLAVVLALAGLVLLSLSIVHTHQADRPPHVAAVALWLGLLLAVAAGLGRSRAALAVGPALGLAAGLLFAGGDISAKLVVYGGPWLAAATTLIVFYGLGTSVLQGSFQHADALTGAGLATLATNAVPIAAGFVVFGEQLPHGPKGALQVAAFGLLVLSGVLLARVPGRRSAGTRPRLTPLSADAVVRHSRRLIAAAALAGVMGGIVLLALGQRLAADWVWAATTAMLLGPLAVSLIRSLMRRDVGVDAIALVAMAGALGLGEYLAGAVISLMLAGGNALEE
ncbi:MAG TPA: hypothetical protein VFJ11_04640, partial [Gaiellaceae bacterium]|nr:hypothetical protein [Gaiellaceae bacterium]